MCSDAAHKQRPSPPPDRGQAFLRDAEDNLIIVRAVFGMQSARYTALVTRYRATAEALGCQAALQRLLMALMPPPDQ